VKPRPTLRLAKPLRDAIAAGHPWVYDRALRPVPQGIAPGDLAQVADERGPIATVFVDPASPIRARVLDLDPDAAIDARWARARARDAAAARAADPMLADTDGWRVLHGENDFTPGLTVDLYAGTAVVVYDGPAAARFWRPLLGAVLDGLRDGGAAITGAWVRGARGEEDASGDAIGPVPELVEIREGAARFEVDVRRGQKTGFFLDQRQNRALVARHAAGLEVLNLFSYTGGFSVQAALGGARRVTSVDISAPAIAAARRNAERSGVAEAHDAVAVDAFDFLADAATRRRRWDVVVCDPPSFAPSEKAKPKALRAYTRLNEAALAVVAPGGLFASASCSSHVSEGDLLGVVAEAAARASRRMRIRHILGAASDHPVLPAFPEGRYLSFFFGDVG
jgi:23S rRNA (cytosine1962-C5)-methyltransferase